MKATTLIGIIPHYKNLFFSRLKPKKRTKKKTEIYFSNENFKQNDEFKKRNEDVELKKYIQNNVKTMLKSYDFYTFDCPMIYYNKKTGSLQYITKIKDIEWHKYTFDFSHLHNKKNNYEWKESSSLYLLENNKKITIGEFQIQNHRDSIKFRWSFINLLKIFSEHFEIIKL